MDAPAACWCVPHRMAPCPLMPFCPHRRLARYVLSTVSPETSTRCCAQSDPHTAFSVWLEANNKDYGKNYIVRHCAACCSLRSHEGALWLCQLQHLHAMHVRMQLPCVVHACLNPNCRGQPVNRCCLSVAVIVCARAGVPPPPEHLSAEC